MGRYTLLLLTSFILLIASVAGGVYISSYADETRLSLSMGNITVYTTMPAEAVAPLADSYESLYRVKVNFVPMSGSELMEKAQEPGKADVVLADARIMVQLAGKGYLVPYTSVSTDSVDENLKDSTGFWTGVWYDPMVFCYNKDYANNTQQLPTTWQELAQDTKSRIGLTDFLAADASANMLFTLASQFGEDNAFRLLSQLHPRVVQYSKYLSTPVRMAGMGEVDASVSVLSEAMRYINDGYPLIYVFPRDGTPYMLTGMGLMLKSPNEEQAKAFMEWVSGDESHLVMQSHGFFFMVANRNTLAYKKFPGKNAVLFQPLTILPEDNQKHLMDYWIKNVRIKK